MGKSGIPWTDASVNPFTAENMETGKTGHFCLPVSAGCALCYADDYQPGLGTGLPYRRSSLPLIALVFRPERLRPVLRSRPKKYFWCSMTDVFLEFYPDDWIDDCFSLMDDTPRHKHQILTKRPERMVRLLTKRYPEGVPPYIWCGVSCEDRADGLARLDVLRRLNAAVRWVSLEPLLEDLGLVNLEGLQWIVPGGESRNKLRLARPCDLDWLRSLQRQGRDQGVPVFMKQVGDSPVLDGKPYKVRRSQGEDPAEWPPDMRVREFPV
jgi:protein gp37